MPAHLISRSISEEGQLAEMNGRYDQLVEGQQYPQDYPGIYSSMHSLQDFMSGEHANADCKL